MIGAWIEDLTWPEVRDRFAARWPVVIPVGARAKEHGPHLPMKTDYLWARAWGDGLIAQLPVLVAPVVDFGYYPAFINYAGSQHLKAETFIALVEDIIDGFLNHGADRLSIANTGVSTEAPLQIAARNVFTRRGARVAIANIRDLGKSCDHLFRQALGGHADERETSAILAIEPASVHMDRARTDYGHARGAAPNVFRAPVAYQGDPAAGENYSATGVRGDPTLATAEKGRAVLDAMIAELAAGLRLLYPDLPR